MAQDLLNRMTNAASLRAEYDYRTSEILRSLSAILDSIDLINVSLLNANWSDAHFQFRRTARLSVNLRNDLHQMSGQAAEIVSLVRELASPLQSNISELFGQVDTDEVEKLIDRVIDIFEITGSRKPDNLEQRLQSILRSSPPDIEELLSSYTLNKSLETTRLACNVTCLGSVRALWAESIHAFNVTLRSLVRSSGQVVISVEVREEIEEGTSKFASQLHSLESNIQSGQSDSALLSACTELVEFVEQELTVLSQLQARLYLAGYAFRRLGKGGESETIGKIAAFAAFVGREAISVYAACLRIINFLRCRYQDSSVTDFLQLSKDLPFSDIQIPNGVDTPIHQLDTSNEGKFVEVQGYVKSIQYGRINGGTKLISRALIKDPSSGATVRVCCIFVNFRHLGITGGSFVRASGIFRTSSELANGHPAVEVDRLALADMSRDNLHVSLLRLSDPWFQVWRNAQNLVWSLGPHTRNPDTGQMGLDGAAEPVFTPFLREVS